MSSSNATQAVAQRPKFSEAINTPKKKAFIHNALGDPERERRFIANIVSSVSVNPGLQECEFSTILAGALLGESLNLSPSPQLGQYYLVPFKSKAKLDRQGNVIRPEIVRAEFVLGYKGYIQLAIRSGQYKKLNVIEIKEGELVSFDPLNEEIKCNIIEDYETRNATPTTGYYAMFEYTNGFRKALYWSREKMQAHADKYSPAYSAAEHKKILAGEIADKDMWKYSSFWYKDFDGMAKKTMLRQLISHWGIMSVDMVQAVSSDGTFNDIDGNQNVVSTPEDQMTLLQPEATDIVEQVDLSSL